MADAAKIQYVSPIRAMTHIPVALICAPRPLFALLLKPFANSACAHRDLLSKPRSELTYVSSTPLHPILMFLFPWVLASSLVHATPIRDAFPPF
jgi:hypothetical protein